NIVDTPAEPPNSMLKHHLKHRAYPCRDINGIVWTYMGPAEKLPPLPGLPWFQVPRDHVDVGSKFFLECNWLQCLEGDNDSVHSAYLHRRGREGRWLPNGPESEARAEQRLARDRPATVDIDVGPWGVRAVTMHPVDADRIFA